MNNIYIELDDKILLAVNNVDKNEMNEYILKITQKALELEGIKNKNIYLNIESKSKEEIRKINNEFRNVDRETDVLSFPIFSKDEITNTSINEIDLGDMFICLDVVKEHSIEYETGMKRELLYMITHSICHLLGYDHINDEDKIKMREREEEILNFIGVKKDE